eukprot:Colp12_sorted_trinity150504_noHs@26752
MPSFKEKRKSVSTPAPVAAQSSAEGNVGYGKAEAILDEFDVVTAASASADIQPGKDTGSSSSGSMKKTPQADSEKLDFVIDVQKADGSFLLSDVAILLGVKVDELEKNQPKCGLDSGDEKLAWATALVVVFLQKQLASMEEDWELMAKKSLKWLKKKQVEALVEKAKEYLK